MSFVLGMISGAASLGAILIAFNFLPRRRTREVVRDAARWNRWTT